MIRNIPVVVYSGDTLKEGTILGPGTCGRINVAVDLICCLLKQGKRITIYLGAGTNIHYPHAPRISSLMKSHILSKLRGNPLVYNLTFRLAEQNVWGTMDETIKIVRMMRVDKYISKEVYLISSWHHKVRLWILWWIFGVEYKIRTVSFFEKINKYVLLEPLYIFLIALQIIAKKTLGVTMRSPFS